MAADDPSVSTLWMTAAMMELSAADVQDMVYQCIADVHEDHERLKPNILSWVTNHMSIRGGPVPLDVGSVHWSDSSVELEIDAICNQSQCYTCGCSEHTSRPVRQNFQKGHSKGEGEGAGEGSGQGRRRRPDHREGQGVLGRLLHL